jgi:hypothetical protein
MRWLLIGDQLIDLDEVAAIESRTGPERAIPGNLSQTSRSRTIVVTMKSGKEVELDTPGAYLFQRWFRSQIATDVVVWADIKPGLRRESEAEIAATLQNVEEGLRMPRVDAMYPYPRWSG